MYVCECGVYVCVGINVCMCIIYVYIHNMYMYIYARMHRGQDSFCCCFSLCFETGILIEPGAHVSC